MLTATPTARRRTHDLAHLVPLLLPLLSRPRPQVRPMSWQAVSYAVTVLEDAPTLTAIDRVVLLLLAEHANRDGSNARPSSTTLARRAGVLPSSVRRSCGRLVAAGIIAAESRRGRPTSYRFPLSTPVAAPRHPVDEYLLHHGADLLQGRDTPVALARHEPVRNRSMNLRGHVSDDVCAWCDGTGWEYEDDNHVRRCRSRCSA
jgi:hypothetical protein